MKKRRWKRSPVANLTANQSLEPNHHFSMLLQSVAVLEKPLPKIILNQYLWTVMWRTINSAKMSVYNRAFGIGVDGGDDCGESCFPAQHTELHFLHLLSSTSTLASLHWSRICSFWLNVLLLEMVRTSACQILLLLRQGTVKIKWTWNSS